MCLKENDNNLLHIVMKKDLPKIGVGLVVFDETKSEVQAFEAVQGLVLDFCNDFWKQGKEPNFSKFAAWVKEVRL